MDEFFERWHVPIIFFLIVAIVAGLLVLYLRWPASTGGAGSKAASLPLSQVPVVRTSEPRQSTLKVYVSGAVAQPGVYPFRDGDRVEDALKLAGGVLPDADTSSLNLAQRLRDEGRIVVPRKGETPVPGASGATGSSSSIAPSGQVVLVNINTAPVSALDALPGIGAVYAQRIVDYRTKNGPFQKVSDLVEKQLIPQGTLDKIQDLIDVQ